MKLVKDMGRTANTTTRILEYFERTPLATIRHVSEDLMLSYGTVYSAVKRLCEAGILNCGGKIFRGNVYCYQEYLEILRSGTE